MHVERKIKLFLKYGIKGIIQRKKSYLYQVRNEDYLKWYEKYKVTADEIENQKTQKFEYSPKISIVVPVYNTPEKYLRDMIESVCKQTYTNWELCIADASPDNLKNKKIIQEYMKITGKIKIIDVPENLGIAQNTNKGLQISGGEYVGLLDHDDVLAVNCLYEVVKKINDSEETEVIYTDEDKIRSVNNIHVEPNFKPDYNLDMLRSNNYICHFFVAKRSLINQIGGFRQEYNGAQDYDLILRCCEKAQKIEHIPKVLYHWRIHGESTAENPESKKYAYEAGRKAISAHLNRCNTNGEIYYTENPGFYRVKYEIKKERVSIVVVNRSKASTLKKCLKAIEVCKYQNIQLLVLDKSGYGPSIKKVCNEAIAKDVVYRKIDLSASNDDIKQIILKMTKDKYIMLMSSMVCIEKKECINELLSNCQRNDVAAVGGKLLNKDKSIYYAGAYINARREVQYLFHSMPEACVGYMHKDKLQQDMNNLLDFMVMIKRETLKNSINHMDSEEKKKIMTQKTQLFVYTPYAKGLLLEKCKEKDAKAFFIRAFDRSESFCLSEGYKIKI